MSVDAHPPAETEVRWRIEERHATEPLAADWEFALGYVSERRARSAYDEHRREVEPLGWQVQLVKVTTTREVKS